MRRILPLVLMLLTISITVRSQVMGLPDEPVDSTKTYFIELIDGTEIMGNILSSNSTTIVIKTLSIPKLEIPAENLKKIKLIENKVIFKGIESIPNPNPTRYFFVPSAFNLKKGEVYFQNTYLFINSLNVGFSNHFSLGAGIEILSTFGNFDNWSPICFLAPKVGFKVAEMWHVGAGVLWANLGQLVDWNSTSGNRSLFLGYGLLTYGTIENNLTFGMGSNWSKGNHTKNPTFTLNGMFRIGRKTAFITENWLIAYSNNHSIYDYSTYQYNEWNTNEYMAFVSYGVRFFGSKLSVDLGFINNADIVKTIFIGVPYADFVVKF